MGICYLKPPNRRPIWIGSYCGQTDWQGVIPRLWCVVCGSEVFTGDTLRCPRCEKEENRNVNEERSQSL